MNKTCRYCHELIPCYYIAKDDKTVVSNKDNKDGKNSKDDKICGGEIKINDNGDNGSDNDNSNDGDGDKKNIEDNNKAKIKYDRKIKCDRKIYKSHIQKHLCHCSSCVSSSNIKNYREYFNDKCAICGVKIILDDSTAVTWMQTDNHGSRRPYAYIYPFHKSYFRSMQGYKKGHLCTKDKKIIGNLSFGGYRKNWKKLTSESQSTKIAYDLLSRGEIETYFINYNSSIFGDRRNVCTSGDWGNIYLVPKSLLITGDAVYYVLKIILCPSAREKFNEKYGLINISPHMKPRLYESILKLLRSPFLEMNSFQMNCILCLDNFYFGGVCLDSLREFLFFVSQDQSSCLKAFQDCIHNFPVTLFEMIMCYCDYIAMIIAILRRLNKRYI